MNIFALDDSPILAAQWQHDRHVVKMTLESAQMLSTAIHTHPEYRAAYDCAFGDSDMGRNGPDSLTPRLYKSTHVNHPCNIWVRESWSNFAWLTVHLNALITEYSRRFSKPHGCDTVRWTMNKVLVTHLNLDRFYDSERIQVQHNPDKWTRTTFIDPRVLECAERHTPFAVCMPDDFKVTMPYESATDAAVKSYQNLYVGSKIHQDHVKWTRCGELPRFIRNAINWASIKDAVRVAELIDHNIAQNAPTPPKLLTHSVHRPLAEPKRINFGVNRNN